METVKIKCPPTAGNPEGVVVINAADFDPAKHTRVGGKAKESAPPPAEPSETDAVKEPGKGKSKEK